MAGGGARPGAGRKPKIQREGYAEAIRAAEDGIRDRLPILIDGLVRLATGDPPDRQAAEYLVNRVMGRPTERVEQKQDIDLVTEVIVKYAREGQFAED
jgi:hypothetical protein